MWLCGLIMGLLSAQNFDARDSIFNRWSCMPHRSHSCSTTMHTTQPMLSRVFFAATMAELCMAFRPPFTHKATIDLVVHSLRGPQPPIPKRRNHTVHTRQQTVYSQTRPLPDGRIHEFCRALRCCFRYVVNICIVTPCFHGGTPTKCAGTGDSSGRARILFRRCPRGRIRPIRYPVTSHIQGVGNSPRASACVHIPYLFVFKTKNIEEPRRFTHQLPFQALAGLVESPLFLFGLSDHICHLFLHLRNRNHQNGMRSTI